MAATKTIKTETQYRSATFDRSSLNTKTRTIELSFSSEEPVARWFGVEVLSHDAGSVRMGRLQQSGPLLLDHDPRDQVGVVDAASITKGRGLATVRFSKSARAEEIYQDVLDGIRSNVSVGYAIHEMKLEQTTDGADRYRAIDWEPMELSLISIPADISVGVGRSASSQRTIETRIIGKGIKTMAAEQWTVEQKKNFREQENERISQIENMGQTHKVPELARKAIKEDWSIDQMRAKILDNFKPEPLITPEIGLSHKEVRQFSFLNAITSMFTGKRELAGFELEVSNAVAQKMGKSARGMYIPWDVLSAQQTPMGRRDLLAGTATIGGNIVATNLLHGSFIDILRNRVMVYRMGATRMGGLVGNVAIPRKSGASSAQWVAENSAPTEASIGFDQVTLSPKSVTNFIDYSRKMILQGTPDIENLVRMDLAAGVAVEVDRAALHGSGSANEPRGIASTVGIGSVVGGTNGASINYSHIVDLETEVSLDNADTGSLGYLTNSRMRGAMKKTQRFTSTDSPLFTADAALARESLGMVNSQLCGITNQVSAALTKGSASGVIPVSAVFFGNWSDLLIGEWGAVDLLVDPYTGSSAGTTRVRIFMDTDIAVRHAQSFAAMLDALG